MTVSTIGSTITGALTSGFSLITSVADGLKNALLHIFTDGTTTDAGVYTATGISEVGIILLVFGGVALAFGISKLAWNVFRSKIG